MEDLKICKIMRISTRVLYSHRDDFLLGSRLNFEETYENRESALLEFRDKKRPRLSSIPVDTSSVGGPC